MRYSAAVHAERPDDPVLYAYRAVMTGKEVNPVRMAGMVKPYILASQVQIIGQMCDKFDHIAVAARLLTKRQRSRYSDNRIEAGRHTFYLFPARSVPADVGASVRIEDGLTVYQ
mgnify:CR=1 FL=1|jgi:hypothetical protein